MIAFDYYLSDKNFEIGFKSKTREIKTWREELSINAQEIAQSTNKPLYVFMSGGIDSEVVARTFLENNISFKAITLKFKNGENDYDTYYADTFCKENGIEHKILKIDFNDFLNNQISNFIKQGYKSNNIYYYLQLVLLQYVEDLGGFGIGGAGEQVYYTIDNQVNIKINPSYVIGMEWCKNNNLDHQWWFNLNSSELYASYMNIDIVNFLLKRPNYFDSHHYASIEKTIVYHGYWPEMQKRFKSGGFLNVMPQRKRKEVELQYLFKDLKDKFIKVRDIKKQIGISYE
jgi:hypothetical protein